MPRDSSAARDEHVIAEATGFDLSDVDEVDIARAASSTTEPRRTRRDRKRADCADDVLAMCALLIFQDRPRKRIRGGVTRALPGI